MGSLSPTRQEMKIGAEPLFRSAKFPERDIGNLTSYLTPRQLYESKFKNRTGYY